MRKQTKVVAVASAAALLAIGASMTSFAATGWVEEDGVWYFYDKDGNRVEDEWKKSGDNWYWLDSEEGGAMAIDKLVEDDNNIYYVDSNGVMVRNTWVKVVNEGQDEDDDPAEYNYYYMQSNGKAYKAPDGGSTKFRTIDGKRYAFDEDGKMLYGWVAGDSTRLSGDSDWNATTEGTSDKVYYLGNWDDGAMKTGWQKITVKDDQDDDEEKDFWFWFKSNGVKFTAKQGEIKKDKSINKTKYGFDDRGVMVYQWTQVATSANAASTSNWQYFSDPESGARVSKGWFRVIAPLDANDNTFQDYGSDTFASDDAADENERWYYADDGKLYEGQIKKIKGKYYGFWPDGSAKAGAMLSGLVLLETDGDKIITVVDDGVDSDELDDLMDDNYDLSKATDPSKVSLFYFGGDELSDGAMKTGNTTINIDGDSYQFMFSKTGGAENKGKGLTGIDDNKYVYKYGLKLKASTDDKYRVVYAVGDTGNGSAVVTTVDSADLRSGTLATAGVNKDGETVYFVGSTNKHTWDTGYKLLNTSGAIVDTKSAAKDGADWYFYVNKKNIVAYVNNKTLRGDKDHTMTVDLDGWKQWNAGADFDPVN